MPWKINRSKRLTLKDFDYPDFWIEVKSPVGSLYSEIEAMSDMDSETSEALAIVAGYIKDWNLTDPDTDEKLNVPTKEAPDSLKRLPLAVIMLIRNYISDEMDNLSVVKK